MDIQKEREAFEEYIISKHKNRSPLILTQRIQHGFSENYIVQGVQDCWETWQAVKAQAVPEGFVLVPRVATKQMVNAGYEAHDGFFTNGQVQDVYQAMIEAQEPTND